MDEKDLDYLSSSDEGAIKNDYTCPMCGWSGSRFDVDRKHGENCCPECGEPLEAL